MLIGMAIHHPTDALNIENLNYSQLGFSKLELVNALHDLHSKGLVRLNQWDDTLVALTLAGRKRALELKQQIENRESQ